MNSKALLSTSSLRRACMLGIGLSVAVLATNAEALPEPKVRIPIGTFHRRGGDGEIGLWSGVATDRFSTLSVTLQSVDAPADPGEVVLVGQIG